MKHVKLALFLAAVSLIGAVAAIPYMLAVSGDMLEKAGVPMPIVMAASAVQVGVSAFVTAWLGLILAERIGLGAPIVRKWLYKEEGPSFTKGNIMTALLLGIVTAVLIIALEKLVFQPQLPVLQTEQPEVSWIAGVLTFIQGGVYEEILLRLFLMSLIVWVLQKLFGASGRRPWMYIAGIFGAAIVFGAGHMPAVSQIFGDITPLLLVRTLVLNGIGGIVYGYLYWKKGLEYAMIAHAAGDIVLHGIFS